MRWKELRKFLNTKFNDDDRISITVDSNRQILIIKNEFDLADKNRTILIKSDMDPEESFNSKLEQSFANTETPFSKSENIDNIMYYTESEISRYFG